MTTIGLGLGQRLLADQSGRLRRLRQVHGNEIGAAKQVVEADQLDAELRGAGRGHIRVVGHYVGAERGQPGGHQLPDAAQPHDADGLAEDPAEELGGPLGREVTLRTGRDEVGEHDMEAVDGLGAGFDQVVAGCARVA